VHHDASLYHSRAGTYSLSITLRLRLILVNFCSRDQKKPPKTRALSSPRASMNSITEEYQHDHSG